MAVGDNRKIGDKEFVKTYGQQTVFHYGCAPSPFPDSGEDRSAASDADNVPPTSDLYVYRMTMTNADGDVVEYPPDLMRYRCEQMGVKFAPLLWRGLIPECIPDGGDPAHPVDPGQMVKQLCQSFYDGPDPVGKTHIREGVVCRIVNRPHFSAYKHKNWNFKVLEGIVKEAALEPDLEEAEALSCAESSISE